MSEWWLVQQDTDEDDTRTTHPSVMPKPMAMAFMTWPP